MLPIENQLFDGHHADHAVAGVCNVEPTPGIDCDAGWVVEPGADRRASVAGEAARPVSGHGRDDTPGRHFADYAALGVADVEIAGEVDRHAFRGVELRRRRRASGYGHDHAIGRHLPDHVVSRVRDVESAARVHRHALRKVELRGRGRA